MSLQEIAHYLQAAIEASVYIAPTEPGLTAVELYEVGKRLGFREGEIGDAMRLAVTQYFGAADARLLTDEHLWAMPGHLTFGEEPERRNPAAFDLVVAELNEIERDFGAGKARLDRSTLLGRADAKGVPRHDVEVAVRLMVLSGQLLDESSVIRFKHPLGGKRPLPSANQGSPIRHQKTVRERAMPHVRDVIERRTDGRPRSAEPLEAFSEELVKLGYGRFRLW